MNKIAYLVSIISLLAFGVQGAYACSCADISDAEIEDLSKSKFQQHFLTGRMVFAGRVIEEGKPYQIRYGPDRAYRFEVERYWKGAVTKSVYIQTAVGMCGVPYTVGDDYLVIAMRIDGKLHASLCTHLLANKHREVLLRKLGKGKVPK